MYSPDVRQHVLLCLLFKPPLPLHVAAQTFANYVLLCLLFTTWLACRSGEEGITVVLRRRGWKYVILAAFDVEANYLVVKAYNYTTLTSITVRRPALMAGVWEWVSRWELDGLS